MDSIRPLKAIKIPQDMLVTYMNLNQKKGAEIITIGYDNGDIQLILGNNWEKRMHVKYHDHHLGEIRSAVFN